MAQQPSQGPSMMGIMGSSMAGSLAGQAVGNMMFGGGGGSAPAPQAAPAAPAPYGGVPAAPACTFETRQFLECMSATGENMDQCRQFYDMFKLCSVQASYPQQQMQ